MYGRRYAGKDLNFEPSGGLMHASLVLQDKETDSYWSIMTSDALSGALKGTTLDELPLGMKTQWKDWKADHPHTRVLSVEGKEHDENNPYDNYFASNKGFRGKMATDDRMPTKEPIYAFLQGEQPIAVELSKIVGGAVFEVDGESLFLYRPKGVEIFYSTAAFKGAKGSFEKRRGQWYHASGARFDTKSEQFVPAVDFASPGGFDTFWFNWSMTHPDTEILDR